MQRKSLNIQYWLNSSKKDFQVAQSLFNLKYYPQCLFFCHLSLEKMLKVIIIKKVKNYPPYIHDLRRLAEIAGLYLDQKQKQILDKVTTFNIAGRYADAKFKFYKKYNKKEYAQEYLKITKDLLLWLKKEYREK